MDARSIAALGWLRLRRSPIATLDDLAQASAAVKEAAADIDRFDPIRLLGMTVSFQPNGHPAVKPPKEAPCSA